MDETLNDLAFAEDVVSNEVIGWDGINISSIESLRNIEDYSATTEFKGLYALDRQIRLLMNVLFHAVRTKGSLKSNVVLQGPPGCGKTSVLCAVERIIGESSVLKIDATKTTRAGLEKLFFEELPEINPIILVEEIEKSNPENLLIYLGMLDQRGEVRKITSRGAFVRRINSLVIATVNDMEKFERVAAGAVSSRFGTSIHFPRPCCETLKLILSRHAADHGIDNPPIDKVIEISSSTGNTDPRQLCSYLLQSNFEDVLANLQMKMFKRQPSKRKAIDIDDLNSIIMKGSGVM